MRHAAARLQSARDTFYKAGMEGRYLIHLGGKMWVLFPWLGSYAFLALERFLKIRCGKRLGLKTISPSRPYYMEFTMTASEEEFYKITAEEAEAEFDPLELVYPACSGAGDLLNTVMADFRRLFGVNRYSKGTLFLYNKDVHILI